MSSVLSDKFKYLVSDTCLTRHLTFHYISIINYNKLCRYKNVGGECEGTKGHICQCKYKYPDSAAELTRQLRLHYYLININYNKLCKCVQMQAASVKGWKDISSVFSDQSKSEDSETALSPGDEAVTGVTRYGSR